MDFERDIWGAYSNLISTDERQLITFAILQGRLLEVLSAKVNRGDFTERGLARIIGVSQPQMHNVLKGKRNLRPVLADRIMQRFNIDVLSLLTDQELRTRLINGPSQLPPIEFQFVSPTKPMRESKGKSTRSLLPV